MAQSAVGAIRAGCQMLSEGKAEIGKFKKQVEGGIADAKAIYAEVTGIWSWIKGLFGVAGPQKKTASSVVAKAAEPAQAQPVAKKKSKEPEPQFVDVVGQISLRSLERNAQKRRGTRDKGQGTRSKIRTEVSGEKPAQTRVSGGGGFNAKGRGMRDEGRASRPSDRGDNKGPKPQGKQIKLNRNDQENRRDPA